MILPAFLRSLLSFPLMLLGDHWHFVSTLPSQRILVKNVGVVPN